MTNANPEKRELSIDELDIVSGGQGISIRSFMPSIMTKQPTSDPKPAETTTSYPKASFDPVTIKF